MAMMSFPACVAKVPSASIVLRAWRTPSATKELVHEARYHMGKLRNFSVRGRMLSCTRSVASCSCSMVDRPLVLMAMPGCRDDAEPAPSAAVAGLVRAGAVGGSLAMAGALDGGHWSLTGVAGQARFSFEPPQEPAKASPRHHEIWEYCQGTSKVQAQVLQNLRVQG